MEIKIQCGCGTKYKFDVEPVNGGMPTWAVCPGCGTNGTMEANQQIAQKIGGASYATPSGGIATAVAAAPRMRVTTSNPSLSSLMHGETPSGSASAETGRPLLHRTTFFIKERAALLKLTDTYDILDPATGQTIGIAKEEPPVWAKWLRLIVKKHRMPTAINIYENEGQPPVVSVQRGFTFIRSKLNVTSEGRALGYFKSKLITIGGGFNVFDHADQQVAEVKGNWKGWDFRFLNKNGREIGTVTKKWAGLGKELFSSADNYIISLTDLSGASPDTSALLLAAGLSIDVVYKEDK